MTEGRSVQRSLALIHTVTGLVQIFEDQVSRHLPGWRPFNIVDESLLRNVIRDGRLTPETGRRVANYIWSAVDAGGEAVLVTCSSIGAAVDAARSFCPVPLVRVDEGMADEAIRIGGRIGLLATLSTTLDPTRALLLSRAAAMESSPKITSRICEGAFEMLSKGDRAGHDAIVLGEIRALAAGVDVIVLAQASMARVLEGGRAPEITVPVLSSPELGVINLKARLAGCREPRGQREA
jgi:Asp/Glu/hydantoin racemase